MKLKKTEKLFVIVSICILLALSYLVVAQKEWLDTVIFGEPAKDAVDVVESKDLLLDGDVDFDVSRVEASFFPMSAEFTGDSFEVDIIINANQWEIYGMEFGVEVSGPAEFSSFSQGNISGCDVEEDEYYEGGVFLYCFVPPALEPYVANDGVFATLKFNVLGDGDLTLTFDEADVGLPTLYTSGAEYKLVK